MRLLLTAEQYNPPTLGGSAESCRRLAHRLAERGHDVTVIAPSPDFRDFVERDGDVTVVRCSSLPALHLIGYRDWDRIRVALWPVLSVKHTIETFHPAVIHIQLPAYIGLAALQFAQPLRTPVVGTLHALPENPFPTRRRDSPLFRLFARGFWETIAEQAAHCRRVTVPSRVGRGILATHGVPDATVISNGVDLQRFHPARDEAERRRLREQLGFPLDRPVVLYAGRFAPEKRLDVLLRAIPVVLERVAAHLVLVGSGSTVAARLAKRLGIQAHVTFTGRLPDAHLPLAYRAADVFVLPSEAELQGLVLLEAAASGLPLIGAEARAIPELVLHGRNGFLHRLGDPEDMAARLITVLTDPVLRARFGLRSHELAQAHAIEQTVARFEALFQELAGKPVFAGARSS